MIEDVIDSATPLEMGLVNQRPRLLLTPARLAFLRSVITTPPYDGFLRQIREQADLQMNSARPDWETSEKREPACVIPFLALIFLLTDEQRYRDKALAMIRSSAKVKEQMSAAHLLGGMALAYDWLHNSLTEPERIELADRLYTNGSRTFEEAALFKRWTFSIFTCNHLPTEMLGLTAAAGALYGERPGISRWLLLCVEKSRLMAGALGADGASQEGIDYGQYYNDFFIQTLVIIKDLMGVDLFKDCAYLRNIPMFYLHSSIPREAWTPQAHLINFGDAQRRNLHGPDSHLRVLAGYYRDPLAQWFADQCLQAGTARPIINGAFMNLTHYDPTVPAQPPDHLPGTHHFADKGLVYQRSGWKPGAALMAFRCGPHFGHYALGRYTGEIGGGHMQANNGTIYLIAGGDYLLSGDGYFRKLTEYGNTLRLDGQGQTGEGAAWFESLELRRNPRGARILANRIEHDYEYVIGDLAPAYPTGLKLRRLLRKIIYLRPMTWVVIDEIEADQPLAGEARFHSDFPFGAEGLSWLARGKAFALRLTARGTTDWTTRNAIQPFVAVNGTMARQFPVLILESGRQASSALVTVLEVLPVAGTPPANPDLRWDGTNMHLTLARSGKRKKLKIRLFPHDPLTIGLEA